MERPRLLSNLDDETIDDALEAMSADELRETVRVLLTCLDDEAHARLAGELIDRAARDAPASALQAPDDRDVDAIEASAAATKAGQADPSEVEEETPTLRFGDEEMEWVEAALVGDDICFTDDDPTEADPALRSAPADASPPDAPPRSAVDADPDDRLLLAITVAVLAVLAVLGSTKVLMLLGVVSSS